MKVGIVVFSRTGNTLSVAERICKALEKKGHSASIARVQAKEQAPGDKTPITLTAAPDPSAYDALIFAAPVEAFSLCGVMQAYLAQLPALAQKRTHCFVTQHFSKPWLGGNRSVKQLRELCQSKGAQVLLTGVVNWSGKAREEQITQLAERMSEI